jgi:hypothetical protein
MDRMEHQDSLEREPTSPNTAEQDHYIELQLIMRQRQINDLLVIVSFRNGVTNSAE